MNRAVPAAKICRFMRSAALGCGVLAMALPAAAQELRRIDPNTAIDSDLSTPQAAPTVALASEPATPGFSVATSSKGELPPIADSGKPDSATPTPANRTGTYSAAELLPAAQGVFGKGARGLGEAIEDLLKKQGQPDGYIVGKEAGGAFIFGLRYGSGTLYHKIEGTRGVHWSGPSFGADIGGSGGQTFILVYNLNDTNDLFHRFAAGEGQAYLVGGFHISELKRGDVVLIPVRMGAGLRLGLNVGYMKFSPKDDLVPF
jgi:hypothetical protein